jgi:hypothetical protein
MGILTVVGSMILSYQGAAELLNFGAFMAFMGVNVAAFRQFFFLRPAAEKRNFLLDAVLPLSGFLICFVIWFSLTAQSKIIGGLWFVAGLIYLIIRTRGLKQKPVPLNLKGI